MRRAASFLDLILGKNLHNLFW